MKHLLVTLVLYAQVHQDVILELEIARRNAERLRPSTTMKMVFTVIAQHADGSPARGTIACDGEWFKMGAGEQDKAGELVWALPFRTDSRGATIFNPWATDYNDSEGNWFFTTCRARTKDGKTGVVNFQPEDAGVYVVTVR